MACVWGKYKLCFGLLLILVLASTNAKVYDLSHPQSKDTIYWPGQPKWNRTHMTGFAVGNSGAYIQFGKYSTAEHGGTHIDVPRHFILTGLDAASVPIENLIADGVKLDIKKECDKNRSYALTKERIQQWEKVNGPIPSKSALLVYTGWGAKWPSYANVMGTNNQTDKSAIRFPYIHGDAGKYMAELGIKILAVDTPSPDDPQTSLFPTHVALLPKGINIVENVNILHSLPTFGFRFYAVPIAMKSGTGTPLRVFAMSEKKSEKKTSKSQSKSSSGFINPTNEFTFTLGAGALLVTSLF